MAICSENPSMGKGGSYNPNPLQKKLLGYWNWVRDSLTQKPFITCLNGEPCDGSNIKQAGSESWTPIIGQQLDDAAKLLKMLPKPKHFLMTRGSNYHVQLQADNMEEVLSKELNAVPYSGYGRDSAKIKEWGQTSHNLQERTDNYLNFSIYDRLFSVTHHIGFNRWFAYRTTALAREMADMEFLSGKYWDKTPNVIIRSHVHYFVYVRFGANPGTHGITTPAWKLPDSHLFRGGLGGTAPSIGAIEVIVESNGKIIVEPHIVSNAEYPKQAIITF